jgi:hypothetical protein
MTDRQINAVRTKIEKIKKALAEDKRLWRGFYNDGRGLRYLPPQYYLKIEDYSGALRYFNWFKKNFPDDSCFPEFLFTWTITLFYKNKLAEARVMAYRTYFSNTYLFDKFFGQAIVPIEKWEGSNLETPEYTDYFTYSAGDSKFTAFTGWLRNLIYSDDFQRVSDTFIELNRELKDQPSGVKRNETLSRLEKLENSLE